MNRNGTALRDISLYLVDLGSHALKSECGHLDLVSVGQSSTLVKAEISADDHVCFRMSCLN